MTRMLWLVEIPDALDANGAPAPLRWASPGYTSYPGDTPGNAIYWDRLVQIGSFQSTIWSGGALAATVQISSGSVTIANPDGGWDGLDGYAIAGREVIVRRGPEKGHMPDDFPIYWRGLAGPPEVDWTGVVIPLVSRLDEALSKPLTEGTYAGDNVLPDGVEGGEGLEGKDKPFGLGTLQYVQPVEVNTSRHIYHISVDSGFAGLSSIEAHESAGPITLGVERADVAALEAIAPTSLTFDWCLDADGLYIRLGSSPSGVITVSIVEASPATSSTASALVARLLTGPGGLDSGVLDAASFAAFAAAAPGQAGDWDAGGGSVGDMVARLLAGTGGALVEWLDGTIGIVRPERAVTGATVGTIREDQFVLGHLPDRMQSAVPPRTVKLAWGHRWTTFTADTIAGTVVASLPTLRDADNMVSVDSATVAARYPTSDTLTIETRQMERAEAEALASWLLEQRALSPPLVVTVHADDAMGIDIGDKVAFQTSRGFDLPAEVTVIGRDSLAGQDLTSLTVW
jgi:hypothetical protein